MIHTDETPARLSPSRLSRHLLLLPAGEYHRARRLAPQSVIDLSAFGKIVGSEF
jgi:hypothetical protein